MSEIRFYHLQRLPLEQALPQILEKVLERGWRAVVMAGSPERVEALNRHLWIYRNDSFLPHGSVQDGFPAQQPIWLTVEDENPNAATVLLLTDGATSTRIDRYDLVCELFDGHEPEAVTAARSRWRGYKEAGHSLTYFQQDEGGRWEKKA